MVFACSHTLAEKNFSTMEREYLAIVLSVKNSAITLCVIQ